MACILLGTSPPALPHMAGRLRPCALPCALQPPTKSEQEVWDALKELRPDVSACRLLAGHNTHRASCSVCCAAQRSLRCAAHAPRLHHAAPQEPLPAEMPATLYFSLPSLMRCGDYSTCLGPYLDAFPPER